MSIRSAIGKRSAAWGLAVLLAWGGAAPAQESLGGDALGDRAPAPGRRGPENPGDALGERPAPGRGVETARPGPSGGGIATGGDTASRLLEIARAYEGAVALVVLMVPLEQGGGRPVPFGTAWAFQPSRLGTNAHISQPVAQHLKEGGVAYVVPNRSRGKSYRIVEAITHPRYEDRSPNVKGRPPFPANHDVGILEIDGRFDTTVRLAAPETLHRLDSGTPLAFLGFPMESLLGDNVSLDNPIATMQTGIVTGMSDWYLEDSGFESNRLIRHSLPSTGGASGSPLFTVTGEVVGALNAGNIIVQVAQRGNQLVRGKAGGIAVKVGADGEIQVQRAPSAAQINFGQRIDLLQELLRLRQG